MALLRLGSVLCLLSFIACSPQVSAPCLSGAECGAGLTCVAGECLPSRGAGDAGTISLPSACIDDADCDGGQLCVESICIDGDCREDSDCSEDWLVCAENRCRTECNGDGDCPDTTICEDGGCRDGCRADADCQVPYICDPATKICEMECNSDTDCPGGSLCQGGSCRGCLSDADCGETLFCQEGVGCVDCLTDRHCGGGQVCDGIRKQCVPSNTVGVCQPDASIEERCSLEGGCQPGLECTEVDDGWTTTTYCMKPCEVTSDCPNAFACFRNFCRPFSSRQELTCEAYSELGNECRSSDECGANVLENDAICSGFGRYSDPARCTWFCGSDRDCPADHFCEDPPPQEVRQGRRTIEMDPLPRCAPR